MGRITTVFGGRKFKSHILCIRSRDPDDGNGGWRITISTFSNAPSLREAEISGFALSKEIELPWNQLEKLDGYGDWRDVYAVLQQGHNLIDCQLSTDDDGEEFNRIQRIPLLVPKLQRLTLHGFAGILRVLDLPSLVYLNHSMYYPGDFNFDDLSQLIEHSSCPLKNLIVSPRTLEAAFMRCMRLLPSLTTLEIPSTSGTLSASFFEGLAEDNNTLLPNLEVLVYSGKTDFDFGTLLTVLRRRHRNQESSFSQLKCVRIISTTDIPNFDEVAIEELKTLVSLKEGLQLEIKVLWGNIKSIAI